MTHKKRKDPTEQEEEILFSVVAMWRLESVFSVCYTRRRPQMKWIKDSASTLPTNGVFL
jgi:hypothetical protein